MIEQPFAGLLVNRLAANETAFALYWLGQAGFVITTPELRILIDPYLSDYLAREYSHSPYSHARMMPPPVKPERLDNLNFILCTHRHGDHMDPVAHHFDMFGFNTVDPKDIDSAIRAEKEVQVFRAKLGVCWRIRQ